jgi:hypothetical protein
MFKHWNERSSEFSIAKDNYSIYMEITFEEEDPALWKDIEVFLTTTKETLLPEAAEVVVNCYRYRIMSIVTEYLAKVRTSLPDSNSPFYSTHTIQCDQESCSSLAIGLKCVHFGRGDQ